MSSAVAFRQPQKQVFCLTEEAEPPPSELPGDRREKQQTIDPGRGDAFVSITDEVNPPKKVTEVFVFSLPRFLSSSGEQLKEATMISVHKKLDFNKQHEGET